MRELENAIVRLLKERPFYGHFLLGFHRRAAQEARPLGVTLEGGVPTLLVHPDEFANFMPGEQRALLEHCLKHVLHLHMARRKERHGGEWDLACDLAVNPGIEGLPDDAVLPRKLGLEEGLAAEEYYALLHSPFDTGNLEGAGVGNADQDRGGHVEDGEDEHEGRRGEAGLRQLDSHAAWSEADATPPALAEEVVRQMATDALRKSGGELPGELRELLASLLAPPKIPWRQVLRQFVATAGRVGRRSTWKREHRRFEHVTPGVRKRRRLHLLVGVDVSDSTDARELREAFASELMAIARGRDCLCTVLYAGSRIQRIDSFRGTPHAVEVFEGGGFTDLRPVFDYARQMQPRPAAVIYLTDGFGPAPEAMALPTLWVLTAEGEKPADWGVELRLRASD